MKMRKSKLINIIVFVFMFFFILFFMRNLNLTLLSTTLSYLILIKLLIKLNFFRLNVPKIGIKEEIVYLDKKAFSRITLYLIVLIFFIIYQFYFSNLINVVFAATTWSFVAPTPANNTCTAQAAINATVIDGLQAPVFYM